MAQSLHLCCTMTTFLKFFYFGFMRKIAGIAEFAGEKNVVINPPPALPQGSLLEPKQVLCFMRWMKILEYSQTSDK